MSGTYSVFPLQIVVVSYSVRTTNPVVFVTDNRMILLYT